jgi:hypothetical protein
MAGLNGAMSIWCFFMNGSIWRALRRVFCHAAMIQSYSGCDSSHCVMERCGRLSYVAG